MREDCPLLLAESRECHAPRDRDSEVPAYLVGNPGVEDIRGAKYPGERGQAERAHHKNWHQGLCGLRDMRRRYYDQVLDRRRVQVRACEACYDNNPERRCRDSDSQDASQLHKYAAIGLCLSQVTHPVPMHFAADTCVVSVAQRSDSWKNGHQSIIGMLLHGDGEGAAKETRDGVERSRAAVLDALAKHKHLLSI